MDCEAAEMAGGWVLLLTYMTLANLFTQGSQEHDWHQGCYFSASSSRLKVNKERLLVSLTVVLSLIDYTVNPTLYVFALLLYGVYTTSQFAWTAPYHTLWVNLVEVYEGELLLATSVLVLVYQQGFTGLSVVLCLLFSFPAI
jgi:hypothetical protein